MTNEEKAQEICEKHKRYNVECSSLECYTSALEMARWKDEQYPRWNKEEENSIFNSLNDWSYHRYVCQRKQICL